MAQPTARQLVREINAHSDRFKSVYWSHTPGHRTRIIRARTVRGVFQVYALNSGTWQAASPTDQFDFLR